VNSFYGKGLVYKEKGDFDQMMVNMDEAIKYGAENPKAAKTVAKAKKTASKALVNEAAREIQKEHGKEAVEYINSSFKYAKGDATTYYYLTIANNKSKQYNDAVSAANKALELEQGDKSNIYFELGQALAGKGDTGGACNAYKKVTGGDNAEAAKYQMEQILKCS
jgi:tetratricopeptide (TPR) repeat protein